VSNDTVQTFLTEIADLPDFFGFAPVGIHTRGHFDTTPLHIAAIRGDTDVARRLLDAGAEIDVPAEYGWTALHEAVGQGHRDTVSLLVQRGASLSLVNDDGQSPLALAQILQNSDIERIFQSTFT
jgi:ankyrin repeat protein